MARGAEDADDMPDDTYDFTCGDLGVSDDEDDDEDLCGRDDEKHDPAAQASVVVEAGATAAQLDSTASADADLTETAMKQLEDNAWLGHTTIFAVLKYLLPDDTRTIEVTRPGQGETWHSWAESKKYAVKGIKHVFVPFHLPSRHHWVLLHFNIDTRQAALYDSLCHAPESQVLELPEVARAIVKAAGLDWDIQVWSLDMHAKVGSYWQRFRLHH